MKRLEMVFFDIDGTLMNHDKAEQKGIERFYLENQFNEECDLETFRQIWITCSRCNYQKYLQKKCTFEEQRTGRIIDIYSSFERKISYEEAMKKFSGYLKAYEENWEAYDDVIPCLESLKDYPLGIITNGDYEQQIQKLYKIGIAKYFKSVIASGREGVAKPDHRIFKIACEKNGVLLTNSCYVGDDIKTDIGPCLQIGMPCILINRSIPPKEYEGIITIHKLSKAAIEVAI